ncbi:uncharacterized protein BX664DRAFT_335489 [Halteromyces radiatus]|uniref:uncharacterized protein n=1 Tax=Halteromyces radiatus TaxID=101107 RepID=UPI00221EE910|nr:uncharacterized protein BX664DRAFT_335489 [Halteromyces radiatus]KAI8086307.1 hypothetical protein BX664DRAFT_335489 [Halteromyces radiatus]
MVFKSTLLLSLALVQLAIASTVTILNPKPKDVWHPGQIVEFKWNATTPSHNEHSKLKSSSHGMLSIALATGPAQSLTIDRVIASNVNITKGSYKWKVPKTINTAKKYVVEIGPNASDIAFAGYISIVKSPSNTTSIKPTPTIKPHHNSTTVKPTSTITSTGKHEPTSVCIVVPNKNGGQPTIKCHPSKPSTKKNHKKSHPKKKADPKKKKSQSASFSTPAAQVATPSI